MIELDAFVEATRTVCGRNLNPPQLACVRHPTDTALMIVAGPGSGKTTVLVLRALRHMLVDAMPPEAVLITTFTRKGAGEIRSRLIDWGLKLVEYFKLQAQSAGDAALLSRLEALDVNAIKAGTFDSFCQEWLGKTRRVGTPAPVMLEQFAADFVYRRRVFAPTYSERGGNHKPTLDPYLAQYNFDGEMPKNQGVAGNLSISVNHRLLQDLVDIEAYRQEGEAQRLQAEMLQTYRERLGAQQLFDFSLCAHHVLQELRDGNLYPALGPIRALLVDEYQDTNPLQEAVYFELVRHARCAVAVVGDDDQALYRFRGATVELFTNFQQRYAQAIAGSQSHLIYLVTNHRSTPEIVQFVNNFVSHDTEFAAARVAGKPSLQHANASRGVPVLGMFRATKEDLASDLAGLLHEVFEGSGRVIRSTGINLQGDPSDGSIGDAVLLTSSAREYKDSKDGPTPCLPALLREELSRQGLGVFNPRGQDLRDLLNVQRLLGLISLCIDGDGSIASPLFLTGDTRRFLPAWRDAATAFIGTNPPPNSSSGSLAKFVHDWQTKSSSKNWPDEVPLLDLLYKLIAWMPVFQNDPEHLVYLEAIMRCVAQGAHYSAYGFGVHREQPHYERSRASVVRDLLEPIAQKSIDIDEDLLLTTPRNRLNIMTIHQSKGLEYPLVIVDVGSEFTGAWAKQAFRRFPREASNTVLLESALAPHTQVGPYRTARGDLDRTFDDLMRLYYVAFSRAQVALLLVGLTKNIEYATTVMNVATFWSRNKRWTWRSDNPARGKGSGPRPTQPELIPLEML